MPYWELGQATDKAFGSLGGKSRGLALRASACIHTDHPHLISRSEIRFESTAPKLGSQLRRLHAGCHKRLKH